jgi:hypothetical protein
MQQRQRRTPRRVPSAATRTEPHGHRRIDEARARVGAKPAHDGRMVLSIGRSPTVRHETVTQSVRSTDGAFMNGVNLAEVDLAVQEHAQLFMTWRAHHNARHRATVFAEDPQRFGFWIFRHKLPVRLRWRVTCLDP